MDLDKIPDKFNFFKKKEKVESHLSVMEDRTANLLMTFIMSPLFIIFLALSFSLIKAEEIKQYLVAHGTAFYYYGLYLVTVLSISDFIMNFFKYGIKKKEWFKCLHHSFSLSFTNFLTYGAVSSVFWPIIKNYLL